MMNDKTKLTESPVVPSMDSFAGVEMLTRSFSAAVSLPPKIGTSNSNAGKIESSVLGQSATELIPKINISEKLQK